MTMGHVANKFGPGVRPIPARNPNSSLAAPLVRALLVILAALVLAPSFDRAQPVMLRLPFRSVLSLILVQGKVEGQPVTFLLDTGSMGTVVSIRSYPTAYFKLHSIQQNAHSPGISGQSVAVNIELELGSYRWASQRVSVMNLDELPRILGIEHLDGLIGEDVLREFRSIRIDYHTHIIELEE
jgi:hypothetical protein